MTLQQYRRLHAKTPKEDYASCVIHQDDWPRISEWLKENHVDLRGAYFGFERGPYNLVRVLGDDAVTLFSGGCKSIEHAVTQAGRTYNGSSEYFRDPLFMNKTLIEDMAPHARKPIDLNF